MLCKRFPGCLDSVKNSFGELSLPKQFAHRSGNVFPKRLAALGVYRRVSEDRKVLRIPGAMNISTPLRCLLLSMPSFTNWCAPA